jgi:positive regulator of sigma E activity
MTNDADTPAPPEDDAAPARTAALRTAGARGARTLISAYSGEHGIYGVVLVTALIAAEIDADTDLDVILFVLGTVGVFWLAHIYAAVVSSRAHHPVPPLHVGIRNGIRHSLGMGAAMLVPVVLLATGTFGLLDEWTAYYLALGSGIVILAIIGYANARRNASTWPWRILGVLTTTFLGLIVIGLSVLVH